MMRALVLVALAIGANAGRLSADSLRADKALGFGREPTVEEVGLFGPSFKVNFLEANSSTVVDSVTMRLAVTAPEQHHGLMFIKTLEADTGMLFLYTEAERRVLWMKNTYVALDAAWFTSDLVLREVHDLHPLDLTYRWSDREDILMGLEMPEGWFGKHGLQPGSVRLDQKGLREALKQRNFDPVPYLGVDPAPQAAPQGMDAVDAAIAKEEKDADTASVDMGDGSAAAVEAKPPPTAFLHRFLDSQ